MLGYCNQVYTTQPLCILHGLPTPLAHNTGQLVPLLLFFYLYTYTGWERHGFAECVLWTPTDISDRHHIRKTIVLKTFLNAANASMTLVTRYLNDERMSTFTNDRKTHAER